MHLWIIENEKSFKPAFVERENGDLDPRYVIEDRGGSRVVVLYPRAPTAFAGLVKLVPRESVHYAAVSLDEFSLAFTHLGIGLSELLPDLDKSELRGEKMDKDTLSEV